MKKFHLLLLQAICVAAMGQPVNFPGQELLGRPTNSTITVNVVADANIEAYFEYGTQQGVYINQTSVISSTANEPLETTITGLQTNTRYYYRMNYRRTGTTTWLQRAEGTFHTQRAPSGTFKFTITSDSHVNVGGLGNSLTWQRTLTNVDTDDPDFLIDCGDTFGMDNVSSESGARNIYLAHRGATMFGSVTRSIPLFLAIGNHEQQEAWHLNDNGNPVNSQPVWGTNAQKRYFLNPVPGTFYTGNSNPYLHLNGDQLPEDYFAWTWGNALFVVIAPYWHTNSKPFIGNLGGGETGSSTGDRWLWTLGDQQYNWLRTTLQNSTAAYKFLFMHHMTGGLEDYIRGGAYAAPYCEWGGFNEDGMTFAFNTKRPTWPATIHQVLVENQVSAVFHGHDHQYAYEIRDGIVYQSLPAAGFGGNGFNIYSEANPLTEEVFPSPGHLRINVTPTVATVDYVSSADATNGQVVFSYDISAIDNSALPVVMEYFTANVTNNKEVNLKWKTLSELVSKQFILQRTRSSIQDYKTIATIPTQNSPNGATYSFVDVPSSPGSWLYRLIHEDLDGKQANSGTRMANIKSQSSWNIVTNKSNWQIQSTQTTNYTFMDLQGRVIETGTFNGIKTIQKPVARSVYLLRLQTDEETHVQKLF